MGVSVGSGALWRCTGSQTLRQACTGSMLGTKQYACRSTVPLGAVRPAGVKKGRSDSAVLGRRPTRSAHDVPGEVWEGVLLTGMPYVVTNTCTAGGTLGAHVLPTPLRVHWWWWEGPVVGMVAILQPNRRVNCHM